MLDHRIVESLATTSSISIGNKKPRHRCQGTVEESIDAQRISLCYSPDFWGILLNRTPVGRKLSLISGEMPISANF